MALSVTRARVKERCGITDTTYDTIIDNLIADYLAAIEFGVRSEHVANTSNAGLQATLNLSALELISAELVALQMREPGACDEIRLGDVTIVPLGRPAGDAFGLRRQAMSRLGPFLKKGSAATLSGAVSSMGGGGATGDGGLE